jgi:hypothetical protein
MVFSQDKKSAKGEISSVHWIQEDYGRRDLLDIAGIGSETEITNSWKVSSESLQTQKEYTLQTLLEKVNLNVRVLEAIEFTNIAYNGIWKGQLNFVSMEYENVQQVKFGTDPYQLRSDWILVVNFREKSANDDRISEKVFMLPDGTVIISNNNFEEVK